MCEKEISFARRTRYAKILRYILKLWLIEHNVVIRTYRRINTRIDCSTRMQPDSLLARPALCANERLTNVPDFTKNGFGLKHSRRHEIVQFTVWNKLHLFCPNDFRLRITIFQWLNGVTTDQSSNALSMPLTPFSRYMMSGHVKLESVGRNSDDQIIKRLPIGIFSM